MRNNKNNITLSFQNIILKLIILISHLTEKTKILTLSSKVLTLCFIILMLSLGNITLTSALSYKTPIGVSFTFDPTLSISLNSSDLVISNLTPGSSSDSNIVNVVVTTNTAYGYTLSATTNNNNLVRSDNVSSIFSSIGTNASFSDLEDFDNNADNNTWGYSYKDNNTTTPTWSNYSGLSMETNTILSNTNDNNTETGIDSVDFKIAAKASNTQPSGIYTGIINFLLVAKPRPKVITDLEYMQDFADLDETDLASVKNSMPIHSTFTLKDRRDEQEYTIAKLADGKIWMTKNLNLAGGTTLTPDTTDFDNTYIIPETQGWQANGTLPVSNTDGFSANDYAYVYNSNSDICGNGEPCYSYYSWDTATLGSGRTITTENLDAPYSICPKGWRLPNTRTGTNSSSDFRALIIAYGGSSSIETYNSHTSPTGTDIYNTIKPGTIPNFLFAGYYYNSLFKLGKNYGHYWSSTSSINTYAKYLLFFPTLIGSAYHGTRMNGFSIRCLAR